MLPKCDIHDSAEPKGPDYQTVEHIKLEPELGNYDGRTGDYDCMDYEETERVMNDSDEPFNESEDSSYTIDRKTKHNKSPIKPSKQKKLPTKHVTKALQRTLEDRKYSNESLAELIAKYVTAKCDKCPCVQAFTTFEDANEHHKTIHDQPGYLICCDKRLSSRQQLKQHLSWHQDQSKFKYVYFCLLYGSV